MLRIKILLFLLFTCNAFAQVQIKDQPAKTTVPATSYFVVDFDSSGNFVTRSITADNLRLALLLLDLNSTEFIWNPDSLDRDFFVNADSIRVLSINAGTAKVGINVDSAETDLHIRSSAIVGPTLRLDNPSTTAALAYFPFLELRRSGNIDDPTIGVVGFTALDGSGTFQEYGAMRVVVRDTISNSHDGRLSWEVPVDGLDTEFVRLDGSNASGDAEIRWNAEAIDMDMILPWLSGTTFHAEGSSGNVRFGAGSGFGAQLDLVFDFATRATSPSQVTTDQNDYNRQNSSLLRIDTDGDHTFSGFADGQNGLHLWIANVGSNPVILGNQDAASSAANRIITGTGADFTIASGDPPVELIYDATTQRWRLGGSAGAGGGAGGSGQWTDYGTFLKPSDVADIAIHIGDAADDDSLIIAVDATGRTTFTTTGDFTFASDGTGDAEINLPANSIGNAELADMLAYTIKMKPSGSTGDPQDTKISALTEASVAAGDWVMIEKGTGELRKTDPNDLAGHFNKFSSYLVPADTAVNAIHLTDTAWDDSLILAINTGGDVTATITGNLTVTTDGTGDSEVVLPNQSIGNAEHTDMTAYTVKLRNSVSSGAPGDVKISSLTEKSPLGGDWIFGEAATGELRKYDVDNMPAPADTNLTATATWPDTLENGIFFGLGHRKKAFTITHLRGACDAGTVTFKLEHRDPTNRFATGTVIDTIIVDTDETVISSGFDDATIPDNRIVMATVIGTSGTPTYSTLTYWAKGPGATQGDTQMFSRSVIDTVKAADLMYCFKAAWDLTITEITGATDVGTVTFNVEQRGETTPNSSETDVMSADLVADTNQQEQTSFADATVPAGTRLYITVSAVSGGAKRFDFDMHYIRD